MKTTDMRLRSETVFRLEVLKFFEELFPDDTGFRDTSGWKCQFAQNFVNELSLYDIEKFVKEVLNRMKIDIKTLPKDEIRRISMSIYSSFKYTMDEQKIGFILKSKTVLNRISDRRFIIVRLFLFFVHGFKKCWNGLMETLKI